MKYRIVRIGKKPDTLHRQLKISKRWLICWAASFCLFVCGFAQERNVTGYEINSQKIRLQIFPESNSISCIDTLSIKLKNKGINEVTLGLLPVFNVESLFLNGKKVDVKRDRDSLRVYDIPSDSQVQVIVKYSGTLLFRSEFTRLTAERGVFREEEIFPQSFKQLQFVRLTIVVPKEWKSIAVGNLIAVDSSRDSTTYVWQCDQPLPTIGWICVGTFWSWQTGTMPISVHFFEKDSGSAVSVSSLAQKVLRFYSEKFSPYRFSKLDIVEVEDWVAGKNVLAIASPSFIMVKKIAFTTGDRFNQVQSILPHEIAHQWWPLTVFLRAEDIAFLSEGMCEYSALLFSEANGTMTRRDSLNHHPLLRSLLTRVMKGDDMPLQQKADLRSLPTHYLKASYVHNMLRQIMGDSLFLRLYHEFVLRFNTKQASMNDFEMIAQELSGKKLEWFFDQWVKRHGVPRMKIYNVKSNLINGSWFVHGRVRMLGYDKYTTFADVGITTLSGTSKTRVWLGVDTGGVYRNDVPFEITVNEKPYRAILDPEGDVLKLQKLPVKLGDLRDPSDGLMIVGTLRHSEYLLSLVRKDSAEMDNAGWSITIKNDSNVTLGDLQNERVFLYGNISENRVVTDQYSKFPMSFHGDSVIVNGETVFDSTLTLMQIIESPFITHGLLVWIAALSEKAQPELLPYDASWILVRGKDEITSGTWEVQDEDLSVEIR